MAPHHVVTLLALTALVSAPSLALKANHRSPVVKGTINLVVANGNGIVAVTDSMQSYRTSPSEPLRQLPEPGQKLFRLDDRTVCTIAGFGSAPVPAFPEFTDSAIGILRGFKGELEHSNPPFSFDDKLRSVAFIFEFHLGVIANVRNQNPPGDYYFELLMAGYDLDGTPKIGKVVLSMTLSEAGFFSPVVADIEERTVGSKFTYYLAGQSAVAQLILDDPSASGQSDILRKYTQTLGTDGGSSLTLVDLKELGLLLAHRTAVGNPTVGGQDQVAVLLKQTIQSLDQPRFNQPGLVRQGFTLLTEIEESGGGELIESASPMILIKCKIANKTLYRLDNKYFFS